MTATGDHLHIFDRTVASKDEQQTYRAFNTAHASSFRVENIGREFSLRGLYFVLDAWPGPGRWFLRCRRRAWGRDHLRGVSAIQRIFEQRLGFGRRL